MKYPGHALWVWIVTCAWVLGGCATSMNQAPVVERQASTPPAAKTAPPASKAKEKPREKEKDWRPETYTVKKGDTLYSIGLEHGYDYKDIARRNAIDPPYLIRVGQQLRLKGESATAAAAEGGAEAVVTPLQEQAAAAPKPLKEDAAPASTAAKETQTAAIQPAKATDPPQAKPENVPLLPDEDALEWSWPTQGKIVAGHHDAVSAKGVDIGGQQGQPVTAAAPGKVVYSGSGLRGYGKLIIVKHNKTYLSAYAHNSQLLVKEGQEVARGQKIAEMGSSDTDRVKLHFEIRRLGKPVDPAKYLPTQ